MIMPAMLVTTASLMIQVADTVPHYDVRSTCQRALALALGSDRSVENCLAGEESARKDLGKDWAKAPAAEQSQCMDTVNVGGSPSYVELLTCLEMMRDSRKLQEEDRTAKTRKSAGRGGTATEIH
jgi:hypothetical protein